MNSARVAERPRGGRLYVQGKVWYYFVMKILVISPHPDDLEISMGGTAAKLADEGNDLRSIVLTDGHRSPRSFECTDEEMIQIRKREGSEAHKILGIKDFEYFGLPNADDKQKVKNILRSELQKDFDVIYMPDLKDMHPTHKLVAGYVLGLVKELGLRPTIYAYDGWNFLHHPLEFVDIGKYIGQKVKAIRAHQSQVKDKPYDEAMEKFARVRAILMDSHKLTDLEYAESFKKIIRL